MESHRTHGAAVCENPQMKFRTGLVIGLAAGYVLGAKAGRERYDKIVALSNKLKTNESVLKAAEVAERTTRKPRGMAGDGLVQVARMARSKAEGPKPGSSEPDLPQPDSK
jgi:hypothetical protein